MESHATQVRSANGENNLSPVNRLLPHLEVASEEALPVGRVDARTRLTDRSATILSQGSISNLNRSLNKSREEVKERVQKIFSLADIRIDGDREWDITVNNDHFYARLLRLGSLGLGESYMDGWWVCRALDQFFSRILEAGIDEKAPWDWRSLVRYVIARSINRQTRSRAKQVAEQHYDLGNELYQNMLDHRMVYTCARWAHASNLDEAQELKLDFVCRKLDLQPGMKLLDIGCGWGSLAKFAAENYGAKVLGITLSRQQMQLAQFLCEGLPIEIRLQDYRDVDGTFDRIASLGMFEHVGYKNYRKFFEVAQRSLRPGGFFFLSTIGANRSAHTTDPWVDKYIFPNSHCPSAMQITAGIEGLFVLEDWENWAPDYHRTIMAWFHNFQKHWRSLRPRYDERFYRMWEYYLMLAAACFRSRKNQVWQILMIRQ